MEFENQDHRVTRLHRAQTHPKHVHTRIDTQTDRDRQAHRETGARQLSLVTTVDMIMTSSDAVLKCSIAGGGKVPAGYA